MRKSLIFLFILLLCAGLTLAAGFAAVDAGQDAITVTETTLYGDPAAAAGLLVENYQNLDRKMFWHTSYEAGAEPQAETEFEYTLGKRSTERGEGALRIGLMTASANFGMVGTIQLSEEGDENGDTLILPVIDVAERTPAGESHTEVVDLQEYYEYYPVALESNFPLADNTEEEEAAFRDYFRIPVSQQWVEVTVTKEANGEVSEVNSNLWYPTDGDYEDVELFSTGVVTEDCVYLLLTGNGDFSQIQGGYGIYRIPIRLVKQHGATVYSTPRQLVALDEIENIFPLDAAMSHQLRLEQSADPTELLLFRELESGSVLQVLDAQTAQVKQELELGRAGGATIWPHEDLLVLAYEMYDAEKAWIQIYEKTGGQYVLWMEDRLYPMNDDGFYYDPVLAFDGERFALASAREYYRSASCRISVYGPEGLQYAGDYFSDSDTLPEQLENYNWVEPLQITWLYR